jgi:hypothetical protein
MTVMVPTKDDVSESGTIVLRSDWSVSETGGVLINLMMGDTPQASLSWLEERETLIALLSDQYRGVSSSVIRLLRDNPDLTWSLIEAKTALLRAFGPSAVIRLMVVTDVDDDDGQEQLFAYVKAALDREKLSRALERFDEEWFLERSSVLAGRLSFDLEF